MSISTSNIGTNISQFSGETITNNVIELYEIDLNEIGIENTEYGNNTEGTDKYVVSQETGRVYYLKGVKFGSNKYYTLTEDLMKIVSSHNFESPEGEVSNDSFVPAITTDGFNVKSGSGGTKNDIYLTNIVVSDQGNDIKVVKYELDKIDQDDAKAYFSEYGRALNDKKIKVTEGAYITIYAEDNSGNFAIKQEGIPKIPQGFYYVGGTIPTGVVISDNVADSNKGTAANGNVTSDGLLGNQFVWIPVYNIDGFITQAGYKTGNLQATTNYTEPYTNGYPSEVADYNAMRASVEEHKGFYIGRYEAGTTTARIYLTATSSDLLVQKGKPVYNYLGWGPSMTSAQGDVTFGGQLRGKGAVQLSKEMYEGSNSVVSHLIYGVEWDAALRFIDPEFTGYVKDSSDKGNYTGSLVNTGYYAVNNIYDMAGNVYEWTMEASSDTTRVARGGAFNTSSSDYPASTRNGYGAPDFTNISFGFRVSLYLK